MIKFIMGGVFTLFLLSGGMSVFFHIKNQERNANVHQLLSSALHSRQLRDRTDTVSAVALAVFHRTNHLIRPRDMSLFDRLEGNSCFNISVAVSLKYGGYAIEGNIVKGKCGTMTTATLNCLWELGIPARKLQISGQHGGHTIMEFFDKGRWMVMSPCDSAFLWHNADGSVATAQEIHDNPTIFRQIYRQDPTAPYSFETYGHVRWAKLSPVVAGFVGGVIGRDAFNNVQTPKLFDNCRQLFLVVSLGLTVFFGMTLSAMLVLRRKFYQGNWGRLKNFITFRPLHYPVHGHHVVST